MDFLYYPLGFVLLLGIVVSVHESGHYFAARIVGVHVVRFSIGFGKALFGFENKHGTIFTLSIIPLGGYVKLLGEEETDSTSAASERLERSGASFLDLSGWQKIFIAVAGPAANFVLAVLVFATIAFSGSYEPTPMFKATKSDQALFEQIGGEIHHIVQIDGLETKTWSSIQLALADRMGDSGVIQLIVQNLSKEVIRPIELPILEWHRDETEPDLLSSLGIRPAVFPIIGQVAAESPASIAGLMKDDLVVDFGGVEVENWTDLVRSIEDSPGSLIELQLVRNGRTIFIMAEIGSKNDGVESTIGYLGIGPKVELVESGLGGALIQGSVKTWDMSVMTLSFLKKMIFGELSTGNLMGPIGIAKVAGEVVQTSLTQFLTVLALMSLSLGIINLMPIPMLDGGMVVLNLIELILGKPVPEKIQVFGFQFGVILIGGLLVFVTYNDLLRIF